MWLNPRPSVTVQCVSTNDQMIQSNVVPPIEKCLVALCVTRSRQVALRTEIPGAAVNAWTVRAPLRVRSCTQIRHVRHFFAEQDHHSVYFLNINEGFE